MFNDVRTTRIKVFSWIQNSVGIVRITEVTWETTTKIIDHRTKKGEIMFIRKTKFIEYQADRIGELQQELNILRELVKAKNEFIESKQNEIYELKRQNRILTDKVDNLQSRQEGMVISYG